MGYSTWEMRFSTWNWYRYRVLVTDREGLEYLAGEMEHKKVLKVLTILTLAKDKHRLSWNRRYKHEHKHAAETILILSTIILSAILSEPLCDLVNNIDKKKQSL